MVMQPRHIGKECEEHRALRGLVVEIVPTLREQCF